MPIYFETLFPFKNAFDVFITWLYGIPYGFNYLFKLPNGMITEKAVADYFILIMYIIRVVIRTFEIMKKIAVFKNDLFQNNEFFSAMND